MSMLAKYSGSNLVCNGYKDREYMELVRHSLLFESKTDLRVSLRLTIDCKLRTGVVGISLQCQHLSF